MVRGNFRRATRQNPIEVYIPRSNVPHATSRAPAADRIRAGSDRESGPPDGADRDPAVAVRSALILPVAGAQHRVDPALRIRGRARKSGERGTAADARARLASLTVPPDLLHTTTRFGYRPGVRRPSSGEGPRRDCGGVPRKVVPGGANCIHPEARRPERRVVTGRAIGAALPLTAPAGPHVRDRAGWRRQRRAAQVQW